MKTPMDEASLEQQEKSPFVCTSCDTRYSHSAAKKQEMTCCGKPLSRFDEVLQELNRDPSPAGP